MSCLQTSELEIGVAVMPSKHSLVLWSSSVHSGAARTKDHFPSNDESSRTDTEFTMVAMLSEQLKSLGEFFFHYRGWYHLAGTNTTTDDPSSVPLLSDVSVGTTNREESVQYDALHPAE